MKREDAMAIARRVVIRNDNRRTTLERVTEAILEVSRGSVNEQVVAKLKEADERFQELDARLQCAAAHATDVREAAARVADGYEYKYAKEIASKIRGIPV